VAKVPLEEEPEFIATFLGSRVHEALELIYDEARNGRLISPDDVVAYYRCQWAAKWCSSIVMPDGSASDDFSRQGEGWVRDYYDRYVPFNDAKTIGLEMPVLYPLDPEARSQIRGFIDRLARSADGAWEIHDYKTTRRLPTQADKDHDSQLALYEIGIRRMWPDIETVELIWHYVRFDHTIRSRRTSEQLDALQQNTLGTIADIEARDGSEDAFPTKESGLCSYCEYQVVCPVRKHLCVVRKLPANEFLEEPGVVLVDRWNSLKAKQDELKVEIARLESEIDQIKEALCVLAARDGLTNVVGSEKEVAITEQLKVMFPRKGQEPNEAAQLDALLRASPWWQRASCLDRSALSVLWDEREREAAGLCEILERFAWIDDQRTLSLRKRRK
jgi:putative RecB family exonuclease